MAGHPTIWFYIYGVIVPVLVLVASLSTGWGGLIVVIGSFLWIGFAISLLSPKEPD